MEGAQRRILIMFPRSVGFKERTGKANRTGFRYLRISHIVSLMIPTRKDGLSAIFNKVER